MPINESLKPVILPMDLKFDKTPSTVFQNNLTALKFANIESANKIR